MKNLFKNFAFYASVALVAASFASCHRASDGQQDGSVTTKVVELDVANTLVVKLSKSVSGATVTYAGKTATTSAGATYTFANVAKKGNLVLGGTLVKQTINVDFGNRHTLVLEVNAAVKSTETVAQATMDAPGGEVNNDTDNQNTTTVKANVKVNGKATYKNADPYTLTVYRPTLGKYTDPASLKKNQKIAAVPFAIECEPSGATFADPGAHMTLTIPGIGEVGVNGVNFTHVDGTAANNKAVSGNVLSADLPHFSPWQILCDLTISNISVNKVEIAHGAVNAGSNKVNYSENFGYNTSETNEFIKAALQYEFGAAVSTVGKVYEFTSSSTGTYSIKQEVYSLTIKAGEKTFNADVNGTVTAEITSSADVVPAPVPDVHNGGSND
jgi:hypothetical protein